MNIVLPKPHINQKKILEDNSRFIVVLAGRRFGKSELSQILILINALKGQRVAYITPTYLLASVFFNQLIKILPESVARINKSDLTIDFITGGSIRFFTGERLDNLRGQKFHLIVLDEAPFIQDLENGWNNAIRPTLTDYKGRALFISTPRGKDFFYSLYLKGINGEEGWSSHKFTTYDNPYIDTNEIDDAKKQLPSIVFEQEYLANPMENTDCAFPLDVIEKNVKKLSNLPPVAYGIDLAKSTDYTCIIGLDKNGVVCEFQRFQNTWSETKNRILALNRNVPTLIDSTGVGDPLFEELSESFKYMQGFKFTSPSKQNLIRGLQSAMHSGMIGYPEGILVEELKVFEYKYSENGVKYNAASGFNDDTVIALALATKMFNERQTKGKYSLI